MRDNKGRTPLAIAVECRSLRVARKLVELGAAATALDLAGRSILAIAASIGENDACLALALGDSQTDCNLADNDGITPLCACVQTKDIKMVRKLLEAGADVNIQQHGTARTALHDAVLLNWLDGCDALLGSYPSKDGVKRDAKIVRDADGYTPLDYSRTAEIFELIRDYVERLYPKYDPKDHPVNFMFAMTFDEGRWELQTDGENVGQRVLKRRKVSKAVAAKRVEHNMIDKVKPEMVSVQATTTLDCFIKGSIQSSRLFHQRFNNPEMTTLLKMKKNCSLFSTLKPCCVFFSELCCAHVLYCIAVEPTTRSPSSAS